MNSNLLKKININKIEYKYVDLANLFLINPELNGLPFSMRILFENEIRNKVKYNGSVEKIIQNYKSWLKNDKNVFEQEIKFYPSRVLMQDFTGVPAVVDLAAMRDAAHDAGKDASKINPLIPVDLVIDHSVQVNYFGSNQALYKNVEEEMRQNIERYKFLKWGQHSFENFKLVPPGMGICHQVNLECLASVIFNNKEEKMLYPETIVGTDSHTTMINGLSVLGWGVGGIEAESAMLGEPIAMNMPIVVGFELKGLLSHGATATDLVLTITNMLRKKGVVGKFVEFYGEGMHNLSLPDRATIANMAPEYGATCGFFPIDQKTIDYLELSGRDTDHIEVIKEYTKQQMLWADYKNQSLVFHENISLDLSEVRPSLAGPTRPQDLCLLNELKDSLLNKFPECANDDEFNLNFNNDSLTKIKNGDIVLAAITSCTNTSNPSVLIAAGLLARNALQKGLKIRPWIKTSLAPGSKVVSDYLINSGLQDSLDKLGFNIVGYGCTTCIGNSGPLVKEVEQVVHDNDLCVGAILSGNRNFEGRVQPFIKANYLASPPLVVAYALAGTLMIDLDSEPIGKDLNGQEVFLKDIWPNQQELEQYINTAVKKELFLKEYSRIFEGDEIWRSINVESAQKYSWDLKSTYIKNPPYFEDFQWKKNSQIISIKNARILALLGDSITTDHISPAGSIKENSPAGVYLKQHGIEFKDFNSYGSRRGNHEVMIRGTFANIRLSNSMATKDDISDIHSGQCNLEIVKGGYTRYFPSHESILTQTNVNTEMISGSEEQDITAQSILTTIYDASQKYKNENIPLVIFAGKDYGSGSSRDWAAKGTYLLGIKAVIASSFERIHRSNLVGMGVVPLIFTDFEHNWQNLDLKGDELISIDLSLIKNPMQKIQCKIEYANGQIKNVDLIANILNEAEIETLLYGGIMQKVLMNIFA